MDVDKLVNTYKILEKRKVPLDQDFVIYAYFLYSDLSDGKIGKQIYLGSYPTKKKAFEEAEKIIKETGHESIYVCEACSWEDIDTIKRLDRTFVLDPTEKSEELQKQFETLINQKDHEQRKNEELGKELELQGENELNKRTIEHYVHNWFLAIKNKSSYEYHKAEMEYYHKMYNMRKEKIKEQYKLQSEFEDQWLDLYQERLKKRGEEDVFVMLREGHNALKDDIIEINNE